MNDSTSRRSFLQAAGFGAAALGLRGLPAWAFQEDDKHHFTIETTTLIVEAEMFQKRGGWVLDQQFMDQMGSPFLLAHGLGKPVEEVDQLLHELEALDDLARLGQRVAPTV